jgi:REP element-mobilizing transposase RayT
VLENPAMSSTHHALCYHFVFGTKDREPWIAPAVRERFHAYIGGLVRAIDGVPTEIGGMGDHVHLLISLKPTHQLSGVMRDVKRKSSEWIHDTMAQRGFSWQDGYGVFIVSYSQVDTVRSYVQRQAEHHRTRTFREEYLEFLQRHMIEFDERFV